MSRQPAEKTSRRGAQLELVWPGKYDEDGVRRSPSRRPAPLIPLERGGTPSPGSAEPLWRNKLVWADNLLAMASLLKPYGGKVDLVYIDPPFATGNCFRSQAHVGEAGDPAAGLNTLVRHAYDDDFGPGADGWFAMLHDRLTLIRELLSERGTLYLHLDWAGAHHARLMLDELFGEENSLGEIVWAYGSPSGGRASGRKLIKAHDLILVYAKHYGSHRFRNLYLPYSEKYVREWFKFAEPDGRRYRKRYRRDRDGRSFVEKQYLDESRGMPCSTVWSDIQQVYADPRAYRLGSTSEVTGFPTQKPARLLERVLELSTEPGDLVADFFCGSGTTLAAAEKLGRRWIGCDTGRLAIHTTRRRLQSTEAVRPFEVVGLGAEEIRRWLEGGGDPGVTRVSRRYRDAVLAAYGAQPCEASLLHGRMGPAAVWVADPESAAQEADLDIAAQGCLDAGLAELHAIAVGFGFDNPTPLIDRWAARGVALLPLRAPRELMQAPPGTSMPGEFRELPGLVVRLPSDPTGGTSAILDGFVLRRPERLPEEVRSKVSGWADFVEEWAVDWDYDQVFQPAWTGLRTRRDRSLPLTSAPHAVGSGSRKIAIRVIDIFGDTTTRVLEPHAR